MKLRVQYAHRFFDFPTISTQPHLEVSNVFTMGVNRGNPDFYEEGRFEIVDNVTKTWGNHTLSFGGNFNHVNTIESFPLFYPFEADFASLDAFLGHRLVWSGRRSAPVRNLLWNDLTRPRNFTSPVFDLRSTRVERFLPLFAIRPKVKWDTHTKACMFRTSGE